jgi:hypothetical protein
MKLFVFAWKKILQGFCLSLQILNISGWKQVLQRIFIYMCENLVDGPTQTLLHVYTRGASEKQTSPVDRSHPKISPAADLSGIMT